MCTQEGSTLVDNGNVSYSTFTDCLEGGRPKMEVWAMEVRGGGSIQEKNIVNNDYDYVSDRKDKV